MTQRKIGKIGDNFMTKIRFSDKMGGETPLMIG